MLDRIASLQTQAGKPFRPFSHLGVVYIVEGEEGNRQGDNQWQKADADIGHSPAVGIDQLFGDEFGHRATDARTDQRDA